MPSEMLSGPDLGGGFLHQLTLNRDGDRTTFTFHAQDGGSDAGGPPAGPLDVFGYVHPPSPCQFGGPRCWHRRFLLPFEEIPKVRRAYNRGRFVLETMVAQAYLEAPVALEVALLELLDRLPPVEGAAERAWYVGGSTAAWLLGAEIRPRDIDLGTTRAGVDDLGERLAEYLIEPVATTDWSSDRIVRAARAFVGTFREGARVEWALPLGPGADGPPNEWSDSIGKVRLLPVGFRGRRVVVSRPEYALVRAAVGHRADRIGPLTDLVRRLGPDRKLLDELLASRAVPEEVRARVRSSVAGAGSG